MHRAAITPGLVLIGSMIGFAAMAAFAPLYARELGLSGAGLVFTLNAAIVVAVRLARPPHPGRRRAEANRDGGPGDRRVRAGR